MQTSISFPQLQSALNSPEPPLVIDVRPGAAFRAATEMIAGALRRAPETVARWSRTLPSASTVVVYCNRGHEVSQGAAKALRESGIQSVYLEGGIEDGWKAKGGALDRKPAGADTRWVTRERPKIDRIACPWLIARFVDSAAEFLYAPPRQVLEVAKARGAVPYDIPDVHFSHDGERCSFDAFVGHYRLDDPALAQLAVIVRGADTARLELAPQAAGLAAASLGLSRIFSDDHEMLEHGMVLYDALYAWCKEGQDELHTWNPAAYR
ncbi:MAG: chromate resistance protein [Betaproteobacteria bacterium]|nr:chromate resistance protein [Betaproteobacteria bacterium]